jgi:predicted nucleic-acid-binding protein
MSKWRFHFGDNHIMLSSPVLYSTDSMLESKSLGSVNRRVYGNFCNTLNCPENPSCFEVLNAIAVNNALRNYPTSNLDFPDVLICELARVEAGEVLTFDKKMARLGIPIRIP